MAEKRYYWLKLQDNYFSNPKIKKLRRIAGGDTLTIIYLKLQLMSVQSDGVILFEGIEENFEDELALKMDEDADNIRLLLSFLRSCGLMVESGDSFALPEVMSNIGNESTSTERVRRFREKQMKALQCNANETHETVSGNKNETLEIEKEIEKEVRSKKVSKQREDAGVGAGAYARESYEELLDRLGCSEELKKQVFMFIAFQQANGKIVTNFMLESTMRKIRKEAESRIRESIEGDFLDKLQADLTPYEGDIEQFIAESIQQALDGGWFELKAPKGFKTSGEWEKEAAKDLGGKL